MDWKDILTQLKESGDLPQEEEMDTTGDSVQANANAEDKKKDKLHVVIEKKGRKGKTATIVGGFTCSDAELNEIAAQLKKKLGVGGAARGGEILIQGDFRDRVTAELKKLGYRL